MRLAKTLLDFYLNASVHVALSVSALTWVTLVFLNISTNYELLGFVFFSSIVCYNFIKYGVEAEKYFIVSSTYHKYIQIFSFLCFGMAMYFLVQLETKIWVAVGILGVVSSLYAVPMLPNAGNLRSLGGLKIFLVALVWTGFTVVLPAMDANLKFDWDLWVLMTQRFILVLALILPFEIRDLQWDAPELKTLPQVIGVKNTKRLGIVFVLVLFLLTFLKDVLGPKELISRFFLALLLLLVFLTKKEMRTTYFASLWVEGIPLVWAGLIYGLQTWF